MPLKINLSDYGQDSLTNLAYIAGSMNGEVRPGAGIRDRAMIGDVGANRTTYSRGTFGANGASGTSGAALYLSDPGQFSTWLTSEGAAYKNATGMRDAVLAVGNNPAAFDNLSPQMQQNMLASLAAARGVYGTGELRGISGGSTMYSVTDILSAGRSAEHQRYGSDLGVNVGGNTFYGHNRDMSAGVAQGIKNYDYNGAISTAANNLPPALATPYRAFQPDLFRPQGQGFNPDSPTNPGVPDASGYGIGDPNFGSGVDALGYDTVGNPSRPIANAPQPPARPSDGGLDPRGPLDQFSDGITAGLEGAGRAAADAAGQIGGAISGLFPGQQQPAPGPYTFAGGLAAGGNAPKGALDFAGGLAAGGITNLGMDTAPSLPPLQAATDVPSLYRNILGREGGASEVAYWQSLLAQGNSLGSLQAQFIASPEAQSRGITALTPIIQPNGGTAPAIPAPTGLTLGPSQVAKDIPGLYQSILGRQGGADEIAYWNYVLASGESMPSITAKFLASPEAQSRGVQQGDFAQNVPAPGLSPLGSPSPAPTISAGPSVQASDPIADLYRNVLGREGGQSEVGYWNQLLRSGKSLDSIRGEFEASPEARSRGMASTSAPTLDAPQGQTIGAPQG